jgi:hypothetical protein
MDSNIQYSTEKTFSTKRRSEMKMHKEFKVRLLRMLCGLHTTGSIRLKDDCNLMYEILRESGLVEFVSKPYGLYVRLTKKGRKVIDAALATL